MLSIKKERANINIIETNISELASPLGNHLSATFSKPTPTELNVAKLVIRGKRINVIADILNTAASTGNLHRNNVRRKIGIRSTRADLCTYLTSLPWTGYLVRRAMWLLVFIARRSPKWIIPVRWAVVLPCVLVATTWAGERGIQFFSSL